MVPLIDFNGYIEMRKIIIICLCIVGLGLYLPVNAQRVAAVVERDSLSKPYHPEADAQADIDNLIQKAGVQGKNIIMQAGGNWCIWCLRFNNYIQGDPDVATLLEDNFLYYHLNFSKENKNEEVFKKYAPEGSKLGYPFFIVMNQKGEVLEVHDSGSLEDGKGYAKQKVLSFFGKHIPKGE
ncbi:hypothetical protein FM107_18770 [Sphingobacterium sp. JB170]|nr:hypothetical protein FM107_18770 [Sphingobacterium sp. JB170]